MSTPRTMQMLLGDEAGQTTIEWTLVLAVFGIPMIYVLKLLLEALAEYYRTVVFFETLPFP